MSKETLNNLDEIAEDVISQILARNTASREIGQLITKVDELDVDSQLDFIANVANRLIGSCSTEYLGNCAIFEAIGSLPLSGITPDHKALIAFRLKDTARVDTSRCNRSFCILSD